MTRQRGFTLLEVMVATAILAVGLTAVSGGFGLTARSTALAAGYEKARRVAETELAVFLATQPEKPVTRDGREDGVSWQLRAEPDTEQEGLLRVVIEAQFFAAGIRTLVLETREVSRALPDEDEQEQTKAKSS